MTARIPCCVPFCNRTAKRDGDDDEMICRVHGMGVSKGTRKFWSRMRRKANKAMELDPETLPEQQVQYVLRLDDIARRAWTKFKSEAIEAAGGLR